MTAPTSLNRHVPRLSLNRAEVALALGVSVNTVDEMVQEGYLPPPKRWHTRKVWLISEIEAFMSEWPSDGETKKFGGDANGDSWRASA